jgi:L-methionine (R)-S-oxide reductase
MAAVTRLDEVSVRDVLSSAAGQEALLPPPDTAAVSPADAESLAAYRVPRLGDGEGGCGVGLEPEPFRVLDELCGASAPEPERQRQLWRLRRLRGACAALSTRVRAEWVGVYESRASPLPGATVGERALLKLAYVGAPSRAWFPLTEEFACGSNNSTSCLRRQAIVIHDVRLLQDEVKGAAVAEGGATAAPTAIASASTPYYVCDTKVRAEVCAPIIRGDGEVIGLVDCESWTADNFASVDVAAVLRLAAELAEADLLRGEK